MTPIAYPRLIQALDWYSAAGYSTLEVPWIIGHEAYYATKPAAARDFIALGGYLVASAEQSFLELMLQGQILNQHSALTPCFRDEIYDELHQPYFMKVELINARDTSKRALKLMIRTAQAFYAPWLSTRIVQTGVESWDIIEPLTGIELGSYGRRTYRALSWLYGTGLAEPRLSQVLERLSI